MGGDWGSVLFHSDVQIGIEFLMGNWLKDKFHLSHMPLEDILFKTSSKFLFFKIGSFQLMDT